MGTMVSPIWNFMAIAYAILLLTCSIADCYPMQDKIQSLPDQPHVTFKQFSGYIAIDDKRQKYLFYYFVEAETNPASKPLVLWLDGGPGCSSLNGAFFEHGPFKTTVKGIVKNDYSWNKEANMLYLESPVGVGFSYSVNKSIYGFYNDEITARDNLAFLQRWFVKFPQYKGRDFYITGQSYGGHYVPQLAQLIIESKAISNLKGIAIGNPLLEIDIDSNSGVDYFWSHGQITDSTYKIMNKVCNGSKLVRQSLYGEVSRTCFELYAPVYSQPIDFGYVLGDNCASSNLSTANNLDQPSTSKFHGLMSRLLPQYGDENSCAQVATVKYLNRKDVQMALHARLVGVKQWNICNMFISTRYAIASFEIATVKVVGSLVRSGIQVLVYSGDQDAIIPFIGTRRLVSELAKELKLKVIVPYSAWFAGKQVGGWTEVYEKGLSYAIIRGGSHQAPAAEPERALVLFSAFLQGKPLPNLED